VKQRNIAISLAVVGAIAAPFVFHTYKERPITHRLSPLTAEEKAAIAARLKETNDCGTIMDRVKQQLHDAGNLEPRWITGAILRNNDYLSCTWQHFRLEQGGDFEDYPDTLKYLSINAATAGSAFVVVYGLTFLLPALARRYWRWLST
jgi:hypothetical protein